MQKNKIKLSRDIIPIKYDINLKPDLENFVFSGFEIIYLNILKETKNITLHSKDIDIETASIEINKNKIFANKIDYNIKNETVNFTFKNKIPKGKYKLNLSFAGILNDKMRGFYKSSYQYNGEKKYLATTQFEATDARRAFPCFDEPEQKAVFNVSLVIRKEHTAISNTLPISIKEHDPGYQVISFSPTPIMSTYLLAFIVGDFDFIEGKSKNNVSIKVYATKGKINQSKFALEVAIKTLDFFEEYFDIKYPLPTLDMIAIPDFSSGAMENWGAITYRESALLVDEENSSVTNKQWVALVIAHEIAHQWFGNLVTMRWWTHLWLNEGFASYIEYLAVDKIFPEWNIWNQFANHDLGVALKLDSLYNTHPIEIEVHHPDEIGEIFDEVSYSKGASVIRMLADYLGEEKFRDGLRYYLKKHSYKNTETEDLWHAFLKVSKIPVANIMKNWTQKSGYPQISLKLQKNKIQISQKRFFAHPKHNTNTLWQVPINFQIGENIDQILLTKKTDFIPYNNNEILKLNINESGFYRTSYDFNLLNLLKDKIQNQEFSPIDRLGIVRDLFALAENGTTSIVEVLEFLENYKDEDNYIVWLEIISGLNRVSQIFAKTKHEKKLEIYQINLLSKIKNKISFEKLEKEDHFTSLLRPLILNKLASLGDKKVINFAKQEYKKIKNKEKINTDIKGFIYNTIAINGGEKEYKELIKNYKNENMHEEKNRIGYALAEFKNNKILCEVVNFAFSEHVRSQDTVGMLTSLAQNPIGRDIWFKSLKINWQTILNRYGDGGYTLGRLIKGISPTAEEKHIKILKNLFKDKDPKTAKRSLEQVLERMEINNLLLKRDSKKLDKFLKKYI